MIEWKEQTVAISKLKPFERNPRKITVAQLDKLEAGIRATGFHQRLIVTQDFRVLGGHQRLKILKKMGVKEVPVLVPSKKLTDAQFKQVIIQDNISFGEFDFEILEADYDFPQLIEWGMSAESLDLKGDKQPTKVATQQTVSHKNDLRVALNEVLAEWRAYLEMIEKWDYLSPNITKGMSKAAFINAIHTDSYLKRNFTLPWLKHRVFCNGDKSGSFIDFLNASKTKKNLVDRFSFSCVGKPDFEKFISGDPLALAGYRSPADFPISLAKELIEEYCPRGGSVLDPCHGWGGRLVGYLLSKVAKHYTGVDCSPETSLGVKSMYDDLIPFVKQHKPIKLICSPFENVKLGKQLFDFAFTSPPYFDVEKYVGGEQSYQKYNNYENWRDGFYTQLITKVQAHLKPGGVFILQVGSQSYPLLEDGKKIALGAGFKIEAFKQTGMINNQAGTSTDKGEVFLVLRKGK